MKIGNQKQAIALGVVAVGSLGFLGNSIFSSFGGGSPAPSVEEVKEEKPKPTALPENEPNGGAAAEAPANSNDVQIAPAVFERNYFGAERTKVTTKAPVKPKAATRKPEPSNQNDGKSEFENLGTFNPSGPSLPDASSGEKPPTSGDSAEATKATPKPEVVTLKYEGFVDAGNPVAILAIGENRFTVDQGDRLPSGVRVLAITSEKLTLSIKGRNRTLWLGKEINL